MKRILILEPYYGGSHRFFLEGLQTHVAAEYTLFTLPARKWKMRMQLAALWAAEKIKNLPYIKRRFDVVLCSSFVDVAVLRALLVKIKGWNQETRLCTYFHENQLSYPERYEKSDSFQFAAINFHTAFASDTIAFNSSYNAQSFFSGCKKYVLAASEMGLLGVVDEIHRKSRILFPGIDFTSIDRQQNDPYAAPGPPVIVWNHRWEHDKAPERFFQSLKDIAASGIEFRLILLGEAFHDTPECFVMAKSMFREKIVHYGYVARYKEYAALLCRGDIVVSTALHEFFGISIIEAVRAGCYPILPDRLSYPELFPQEYCYQRGELTEKLANILLHGSRLPRKAAQEMTEKFSWKNLAPCYSQWLLDDIEETM